MPVLPVFLSGQDHHFRAVARLRGHKPSACFLPFILCSPYAVRRICVGVCMHDVNSNQAAAKLK